MASKNLMASIALLAAILAISSLQALNAYDYPDTNEYTNPEVEETPTETYYKPVRGYFKYRPRYHGYRGGRKRYSPFKKDFEYIPAKGYYKNPQPQEEEEYTPSEENVEYTPEKTYEKTPTPTPVPEKTEKTYEKTPTPTPVPEKTEKPAKPVKYTPSGQNEYVEAHNKKRSEKGVGPLSWDESLAQHAMDHASRLAHTGCDLFHFGGPYGENLAMSGGPLSPSEAVEMWTEEKKNYDYGYGVSGHYTQVMWRGSTNLGCAKAACDNQGGEIVSCLYYPPGNVIGEKPY